MSTDNGGGGDNGDIALSTGADSSPFSSFISPEGGKRRKDEGGGGTIANSLSSSPTPPPPPPVVVPSTPSPLQVLHEVLQILFQLPHFERIFMSHFSESENLLRVMNNGNFYRMTDEDVLPAVQRFCGVFLDTMRDQLTTANLIMITTLLQRSDWNWLRGGNPWKEEQKQEKRKDDRASCFSPTPAGRGGVAHPSSSSSVARLEAMRHHISDEAAQRYQEVERLQGSGGAGSSGVSSLPSQPGTPAAPPPALDSSRHASHQPIQLQHLEHWREHLLSEVYRMYYQRLQFNVENGFPDDTLPHLCKAPASFQGFHRMQSDSLIHHMSCAEFTLFFNLLSERIKRKQGALHSITPIFSRTRVSTGGGGEGVDIRTEEEDFDGSAVAKVIQGIPQELIESVGLLLNRLCFFQNMDVVAQHRSIHIEELRFIVSVMLSPIPMWSKIGMKAFRCFVHAHYHAHPERGTHPQEVLSTMKLEDQQFIRVFALRRLMSATLTQLSECFTHLLPLFIYPTVVTDEKSGKQKVQWCPCSTILFLTVAQKKRLFTVARSSLHLMRLRPVVGNIIEGMIPSPLRDQPFADDEVILQLLTVVSEFFVKHAGGDGKPTSTSSASSFSSEDPEEINDLVSQEGRREMESVVLCQERVRAYFAACEHCWFRYQKSPWLVRRVSLSSSSSRKERSGGGDASSTFPSETAPLQLPFSTPEEQSYFSHFVGYLVPEVEGNVDKNVKERDLSSSSSSTLPRLLHSKNVHGLLDLMVAIFTFLRSIHRPGATKHLLNTPSYHRSSSSPSTSTSVRTSASSSFSCWRISDPSLPQQLEVALLATITHLVTQGTTPPIRADLLQQILRFSVQTLTLNYMFFHARQSTESSSSNSKYQSETTTGSEDEGEEAAEAFSYLEAVSRERNSVPMAAAELATACLDLYMATSTHSKNTKQNSTEGGGSASSTRGGAAEEEKDAALTTTTTPPIAVGIEGVGRDQQEEKQALVSLAVLSVSLLNGLILPPSHQHLQRRALDHTLLKSLFADFDSSATSVVNVHELLALVFTQRVPARDGALVVRSNGGRWGAPSLSAMAGRTPANDDRGGGGGGARLLEKTEGTTSTDHHQESPSEEGAVVRYSKSGRHRPVTMVMTPPLRADEEENDFILAVDAADTSLLEAGLLSARRITYHHQCYVPLSLQERIRLVEHCIRIYLAVQHRFCVLEVAQAAGIRCLSACAYLCLEDQIQYHEIGRYGEYERRRMSHLAQALWHFYALAMDKPVHTGPQVEKYTRMILLFLRTRVAMIPHRKGVSVYDESNELCVFTSEVHGRRVDRSTRATGGFRQDLEEGRRGGGGGGSGRGGRNAAMDGRGGCPYNRFNRRSSMFEDGVVEQWKVRWINLPQVKKVNTIFVQFISKLAVQSMSRFTERTGITFSSTPSAVHLADSVLSSFSSSPLSEPSKSGSDEESNVCGRSGGLAPKVKKSGKEFFLLNDAEDQLLSSLTVYEKDLLFRNVALRRALRYPVHAFQQAIANAQKDNLPSRRAVLLSELYMTIVHTHAHELLPDMWKEVCTQLMFFRQLYLRADSPGVCVMDTKMGKEVQQFLHQLLFQYLHFEETLKTKNTTNNKNNMVRDDSTGTTPTSTTPALSTPSMEGAARSCLPGGGGEGSNAGPLRSVSGCFLDLSSLSFLYSSTVKASQSEPLSLLTVKPQFRSRTAHRAENSKDFLRVGRTEEDTTSSNPHPTATAAEHRFTSKSSSYSVVDRREDENNPTTTPLLSTTKTGSLLPSGINLIVATMEREIDTALRSAVWENMTEKQYASQVSMLHRALREVLGG